MQKFLTKEQAKYLIEKILEQTKVRWRDEKSGLEEVFLFPVDVGNIINQCTEKEFPAFEMNLYAQDEIELDEKPDVLKVNQHGDYTSPIHVEYWDVAGEAWDFLIPTKKFKAFTESCQRICEWIEEQE